MTAMQQEHMNIELEVEYIEAYFPCSYTIYRRKPQRLISFWGPECDTITKKKGLALN